MTDIYMITEAVENLNLDMGGAMHTDVLVPLVFTWVNCEDVSVTYAGVVIWDMSEHEIPWKACGNLRVAETQKEVTRWLWLRAVDVQQVMAQNLNMAVT